MNKLKDEVLIFYLFRMMEENKKNIFEEFE